MKESFERIVAWAKAHPALAILIVGGVVLLAYLVYKRSGGMAPTSAPTSDSGIPAGFGAGGAVSGGGGGAIGTSSGTATEGGAAVPSVSTFTGALKGNAANPPHEIPSGAQPLPAISFPGIGGSNLGWMNSLGAMQGAMTGTGGAGGNIAARNAGFGGTTKAPINPTEFHTGGGGPQPVPTIPAPSPITNALGRGAGVTGSPTAGGGGSTAQYRGRGGAAPETPAMAVGKGRLFSGTYQGITYASGYPVGTVSATQVTGLTGNRPAVIPTQGQTIRY